MRSGAHAGYGSADELLDLTPYQIYRLLYVKPQPASRGGDARLIEIKGMFG